MSRSITIRSVTLCDHVNRLPGGKSDIIGAYSNTVTLGMRPALLDAMFLANFQAGPGDETAIEFRVSAPKVAGSGVTDISADAVYFDIEAPIMGFVTEEAEITFEWRFQQGDWVTAAQWLIKFDSNAVELDEGDVKKLRKLFNAKGEATDLIMRARSSFVDGESLPITNNVSGES